MDGTVRQIGVTGKPLVSVVIPTYNREGTVGAAIDSVLGQTYRALELIVVDDGSTDGTAELLERYAGRVRVLRQSNAGVSSARNAGMRVASGEIIAFLDSDDLWLPGKIERQVGLMTRLGRSVPCCVVNALLDDPKKGVRRSFDLARLRPAGDEGLWTNVAEVLSTRLLLFNQTVAAWRSALERVSGFDERLEVLEDHDLALRLAFEGPWGYIREPLVINHQHTPMGLSARALRNPEALHACWIEIYQRARGARGASAAVVKNLDSAIRRSRLLLRAERLAKSRAPLGKPLARTLRAWVRLRQGLARRAGAWPAMECADPVEGIAAS